MLGFEIECLLFVNCYVFLSTVFFCQVSCEEDAKIVIITAIFGFYGKKRKRSCDCDRNKKLEYKGIIFGVNGLQNALQDALLIKSIWTNF